MQKAKKINNASLNFKNFNFELNIIIPKGISNTPKMQR